MAATLVGCGGPPPCAPVVAPIAVTSPAASWEDCAGKEPFDFGRPAVVRYSGGTGDSVRTPERSITGPHTLLCEPRSIAVGPGGELYVLNHLERIRYGQAYKRAGWTTWVTVYDAAARDDAAPIRALEISPLGSFGWLSLGVDREGYLYVGSELHGLLDSGSVAVFAAGADGNAKPIRVVAGPRTRLRDPGEIAVDRHNNLYTTNQPGRGIDDTVRIYSNRAAGNVEPCRVIAGARTGLLWPVALAVDRENQLYVANFRQRGKSAPNNVTVYDAWAAGDTMPNRTITGRKIFDGLSEPRRLVMSSNDSLYVRSVISLSVFGTGPADTARPARTFFKDAPSMFALDRRDTLYALAGDTVLVYPPGYSGGSPPVRVLRPRASIRTVKGMAVDGRGWLYLSISESKSAGRIEVYAPGASGDVSPSRTISGNRTRLTSPGAIALDGSGRLYVTNNRRQGSHGAIRVYAPGAKGQDQPVRTLVGTSTSLDPPNDIEFDSHGNMYVTGNERVSVFRPAAYGNEAPVRTLAGERTLLRRPFALAVGRDDTLYVLNNPTPPNPCPRGPVTRVNPTVTTYSPGASGDAEPVRTLVLPVGANVRDLAVDSSGALQVWIGGPVFGMSFFHGDTAAPVMPRAGVMVFPPGASGQAPPARLIREAKADNAEHAAVAVDRKGGVVETMRRRQLLGCY
jgi:hypothetical protein